MPTIDTVGVYTPNLRLVQLVVYGNSSSNVNSNSVVYWQLLTCVQSSAS